jgi:hypothetical protein
LPQLNCTLSPGVWHLLQEHSQKTHQPVPHIVNKALADYFEVAHHTLYQVSRLRPWSRGYIRARYGSGL